MCRAAMSPGRLWQRRGTRQEAYDLLAPSYGWFTEGFDTADLHEAKTLLACFIYERVLRVLPAPSPTQPSPRGRAAQLELRPSPPSGGEGIVMTPSPSERGEGRNSSRNARFER